MTQPNNPLNFITKFSRRLIGFKDRLIPLKLKFRNYSYSQAGEDRIIDFVFNQIGIASPTYLDVGAHHPYYLSNTALFYEKGCRGLNIEPDPTLFSQFPICRKNDINVNCGIGISDGQLELNIMNVPALNTFSFDEARRLENEDGFKIIAREKIAVLTLDTLLKKYNNDVFPDLFSLDVEGLDEDIIKSIDFERRKPIVICLETISYSGTGKGIKNHEIIHYLEEKGYLPYADTNINTIFVLKERWVRG